MQISTLFLILSQSFNIKIFSMVMYIEDAVINTALTDGIILFLTQFSLRIKFKFWRTFLISILSSLFCVFLNNFIISTPFLIIIKICFGLLICSFEVPKFTYKNLILFFVVFISFTFLLGGFSFAVIFLFNGSVTLDVFTTNSSYLTSAVHIILAVYVYFLFIAIKAFYKKQKIEKFIYDLKIVCNNKELNLKGYLDSGNLLVDSKSHMPIIIINLKTFLKIYKNINILDVLNNKLDKVVDGNYIDFSSVGGGQKIFIFKPEKIYIKNKTHTDEVFAFLGFNINFKTKNDNFDVLLSPLCVEN